MSNGKLNGPRYKYASIDTAPAAGGYWSDSVSMSSNNTLELFFSRTGGGSATIGLQYKLPHANAAWVDYEGDVSLDDGVRCIIDDHGAGVKWRAGVAEGGYSSGSVIVGFDW